MIITDQQRLDWLELAQGWAIVSDDFGRWAVVTVGMQDIPEDTSKPSDLQTVFWIKADEWKPSVREAIDAHIRAEGFH